MNKSKGGCLPMMSNSYFNLENEIEFETVSFEVKITLFRDLLN